MIKAARRPVATIAIGEQADAEQALLCSTRRGGLLDLAGRLRLADSLDEHLDDQVQAFLDPGEPRAVQAAPGRSTFVEGMGITDQLMSQVRQVAPQDTTILLSGETGTGKTRLARLIHQLSPRSSEPFLVVNCGGLSPSAIESELFGHAQGSFNSFEPERVGKLAEVGRGTLFLNEIDALPMTIQSKLLRVLEDRLFEPVGSHKSEPVRARLIAGSNRVLEEEVSANGSAPTSITGST